MAKRTVIAPDEELIVKGKLVVTGNLVQIQQTDTITNNDKSDLYSENVFGQLF